jgi:hypothetical protein
MKIKFEWELIQDEWGDYTFSTYRAKVIGGWLIRNTVEVDENNQSISTSIIFISDPEHKWEISNE